MFALVAFDAAGMSQATAFGEGVAGGRQGPVGGVERRVKVGPFTAQRDPVVPAAAV